VVKPQGLLPALYQPVCGCVAVRTYPSDLSRGLAPALQARTYRWRVRHGMTGVLPGGADLVPGMYAWNRFLRCCLPAIACPAPDAGTIGELQPGDHPASVMPTSACDFPRRLVAFFAGTTCGSPPLVVACCSIAAPMAAAPIC